MRRPERRSVRDLAAATLRAPARLTKVERAIALLGLVLVVLYAGLTEGSESVAALGVGVIRPPAGVQNTVYLGVRLTANELDNTQVLDTIEALHATAIVDGRTALASGSELAVVAGMGIDLANGGWGTHESLPWTRASNDCQKAGRVIAREAHVRPDEFVPGRELDAFDQIYCRVGHYRTRLVLANWTFRANHLPSRVRSARIYLLDGRGGGPAALHAALVNFRGRLTAAGYRSRPLRDLH